MWLRMCFVGLVDVLSFALWFCFAVGWLGFGLMWVFCLVGFGFLVLCGLCWLVFVCWMVLLFCLVVGWFGYMFGWFTGLVEFVLTLYILWYCIGVVVVWGCLGGFDGLFVWCLVSWLLVFGCLLFWLC